MRFRFVSSGLIGAMLLGVISWASAAEPLGRLVVFTSAICGFCKDFEKEVGRIYPLTQQSARLPMEMVDRDHPGGAIDPQLLKQIHFTPTLIVFDRQGKERARILGYRGEESFWAMAEDWMRMLEKKGPPSAP